MAVATKPNNVHPSAVVSPSARIGNGCYIGPYSIVGADVELADDVRLESHCVIDGRTTIGQGTRVFPFVSIGLPAQDLKYQGEPSETRIGRRNMIREFVTIHRGTAGGGMLTEIGDDCLLMAQVHIAHDCILGDGVIMANAATLAGHVVIENNANVGAYSGVHQFCRVGREAYIGGYSVVVKDALPFALTVGNHARCYGLNTTGMKRRGYSREVIDGLHRAFHLLLSSKLNTTQALERIKKEIQEVSEVETLVQFIETSKRGVIK
ncbi:MAG TPA: acyl-[acyl-carrier-protein]--UDP-N-acetylglucosamine O-acyltransferase [Blastocatellia bacterium]|jgi:UDP-N-acetylglucosamine acyltransferase|nr:acyl-[acyl-carrier-protein]--UDP-N-acetylglucosamine O-acyltransferase [Blastocatellia bacterium]HAF24316.1 acyl-[acyl-carrier-protein]--UDP-N-acetylglucosamine O-acyltransferase [Blastocatellia bacterium]